MIEGENATGLPDYILKVQGPQILNRCVSISLRWDVEVLDHIETIFKFLSNKMIRISTVSSSGVLPTLETFRISSMSRLKLICRRNTRRLSNGHGYYHYLGCVAQQRLASHAVSTTISSSFEKQYCFEIACTFQLRKSWMGRQERRRMDLRPFYPLRVPIRSPA